MTHDPPTGAEGEPSIWAWATALVRWRDVLFALAVIGAVSGLASGLASKRLYTTSATFIPQGSEGSPSSLVAAASQFGLRVPSSGSTWGPAIYVELLRSHALLGPIALDTIVVDELDDRPVPLLELLGVDTSMGKMRAEYGVRALQEIIRVRELDKLGAVKVEVATRWPSVSLAIAERLVNGVHEFNLNSRKSQAAAEREFVEHRAQEAEDSLRQAEGRLLSFLQRNRSITAPELVFERERLQRDVALRAQTYTTLVQSREEARIREVRDTPVITLIETPRLAVLGQPRRTAQKTLLGAILGGALAVVVIVAVEALAMATRKPNKSSQEFFRLISDARPRFLKRRPN